MATCQTAATFSSSAGLVSHDVACEGSINQDRSVRSDPTRTILVHIHSADSCSCVGIPAMPIDLQTKKSAVVARSQIHSYHVHITYMKMTSLMRGSRLAFAPGLALIVSVDIHATRQVVFARISEE
jgi:hypothetical protein